MNSSTLSAKADGRSWGQQLAELWKLKGDEFLQQAAQRAGKPPPASPIKTLAGESFRSSASTASLGSLQQAEYAAASSRGRSALTHACRMPKEPFT